MAAAVRFATLSVCSRMARRNSAKVRDHSRSAACWHNFLNSVFQASASHRNPHNWRAYDAKTPPQCWIAYAA